MAGEFDLIDWIRGQQQCSPLIKIGVGDDLAVLNWPADELLLAGVDQVIDGIHFDSSIHSPTQIGRKAMNRNLSDCAAMGCLPAAALASVALPAQYSLEQAKELYLGMAGAGQAFSCAIIGGDTATWAGKLIVSITILGKTSGVHPVTRGGAKVGDGIFVTGALGGSILGRHIDFVPRVALGRELAAHATAMIDLSDGISRDLGHICKASGVGAVIEAGSVPIHADAIVLAKRDGVSPLQHALNDGDDYELLYTAPPDSKKGIRIGSIVPESGLWLSDGSSRRPLYELGWQHGLASPV